MILVLTPNPALDITYRVPQVLLGGSHRVHDAAQRAGGKGLNVARVLHAIGEQVNVGGLLGTNGSELFHRLLTDLPRQHWIPVLGDLRRTVTVVQDSQASTFNETGPWVQPDAWSRLAESVREPAEGWRFGEGDVLVVSGSHPPGTRGGDLTRVVDAAKHRGARVIVDGSGPALLEAARAGADALKPNEEELAAATGCRESRDGAAVLLAEGAGTVFVSRGPQGILAFDGYGSAWCAQPAETMVGNPTGAGDAAVAALAHAMSVSGAQLTGLLERWLTEIVALSSAAVACPVAGEVDMDVYADMRCKVRVTEELPVEDTDACR